MQRPSKPARALATNSVMIGLRVAIDHRRTARGAVLFLQGGHLQAGGSAWLLSRLPRERPSNPRQSRLYGIGGSSALGDNGADAIVKSSTNLQNSLSLNSRMLAYAATMRNARTRA